MFYSAGMGKRVCCATGNRNAGTGHWGVSVAMWPDGAEELNMTRVAVRAAALSVLVLLSAGCASAAPEPTAEGDRTALGLVDLWRVSGVPDEEPDTWLRIEALQLQLWRECGMIDASWQGTDTLFVAGIIGGSGSCDSTERGLRAPWLEEVTGYRATEAGWQLLDAAGDVVASLAIDGAPEPIATAVDSLAEPPPVTAETRKLLRAPAALPADLTAATAETLSGRWEPVGYGGDLEPFVEFADDGSWSGTDGCNGRAGRWATDGTGVLLATAGMSTAIGCDYVDVPLGSGAALLAGFDGDQLVVLDADATEVLRYERG